MARHRGSGIGICFGISGVLPRSCAASGSLLNLSVWFPEAAGTTATHFETTEMHSLPVPEARRPLYADTSHTGVRALPTHKQLQY